MDKLLILGESQFKTALISGLLFLLTFCHSLHAWNATGHRVIAQIAYDHLTPHAKVRFNAYNQLLNQKKYRYNLVGASTWLDRMHTHQLQKEMHYIDLPFTHDKDIRLPPVSQMNAVMTLQQAQEKLLVSHAPYLEKGLSLRIILHVVGDLHQPLHAATYVSKEYPLGDKGGNLTLLPKNPIAKNLHVYWDQGAGLFSTPMNNRTLKRYAKGLEARWPCQTTASFDYNSWALESHDIAVRLVYSFSDNPVLDPIYQRQATQLVEERVALAGCRLAAVLNEIDAKLSAVSVDKPLHSAK